MSAERSHRPVGPLAAAGVLLALGALVLGGCVAAGPSREGDAATGAPSPPPVIAQVLPSVESAPCPSATDQGQQCGAGPVVSPSPSAANLPSAAAALPTPTAVPVTPAAAPLVVTIADDGMNLHLSVGQRLILDLGPGVDWTVKVGDEQVVRPVTGAPLPAGAQGVYEAQMPGATALTAAGIPHCTSGICPKFRLGFGVTITVSQATPPA